MSEGLSVPGILKGSMVPSSLACLTKWTLLWMCLVCLESFSFFIIAIALVESTNSVIEIGESAWTLWNLLKTYTTCSPIIVAKAHALYSTCALDMAIGFGTNDALSDREP